MEDYFRYVNDILIGYKENHTNIKEIIGLLNSISAGLNFTLELEHGNKINCIDLTIMREENKLTFDIFRKPATTDVIIPSDSCHPIEHKLAAMRFVQIEYRHIYIYIYIYIYITWISQRHKRKETL